MSRALCQFLLVIVSCVTSSRAADIEVGMDEEKTVGSYVLKVSEFHSLFREVAAEDRVKLTFNILDKASFAASFFSMDSDTGVVSTARRVDREAVCEPSQRCSLDFNVAIRGSAGLSFSNIASVAVLIHDINDNSPAFPADRVTLHISEGAKAGTELTLSGPRDPDSPPNNTIRRYDLTLSDPVFSVSATNNPDGTSLLRLRLESELDRETTSRYDFNIIAYDGGDPPLSDFMTVAVDVDDENDNAPVFLSPAYDVSVGQDAAPGDVVVTPSATDRDSGDFGRVQYRFSSLTPAAVLALLDINATTGAVSLVSALPRAAGQSPVAVVVEAFDGGVPPSVSQAVVTLSVLSTGNAPPVLRIVTVNEGDTSQVALPESAMPNDFVAFVHVDDPDEGDSGSVSCRLEDTSQFRVEELVNKGYQVLLNGLVDREMTSLYQLAIVCTDRGNPPGTTRLDFTVIITDVNDNDPKFEQLAYSAEVTENNAAGQYVLQVIATDNDSGDNAVLTYGFLEPDSAQTLSIHPQSGIVTARKSLDREKTPHVTVTLTAVDGGAAPRTGTARLTLTVRDANDNAPQWLGAPYRFNVSEGVSPGHVVGNMSAFDVDQGSNGQMEFFFAGSVNGEVPFTVHTNGTIRVSGVLDRETSSLYMFTVLARDRGGIPKSNSTQVTVTVTDINDNSPVILFPTSVNHSVVITTRPQRGIVLGRVIAYDVDEGNASSLAYVIHSGDDSGVFSVDAESGQIVLSGLDRLQNPYVYRVVLRVYDMGSPPLYAQTQLQIEMNFPNTSLAALPSGGRAATGQLPAGGGRSEEEKTRDSYVIIVAVIGGATLVLSGIIIGAILFVLKSERKRKSRDGPPVMKNHYVAAPTRPVAAYDRQETSLDPDWSDSKCPANDVTSSGVILSPKALPPSHRPEAQKKVSFSLDEPDADVRQIQSRDMLLAAPLAVPSQGQSHSEGHVDAWKRLASPDDMNSDTSGDSGTCDSGRGASDDDIHPDIAVDRRRQTPALTNTNRTPALTNTNRTPALTNTNRTPAPANIYTPPSSFTGGSSFRGQGQGHRGNLQGQTHPSGGGGGWRSSTSSVSMTSRPRFLQTGSYHEGRYHQGPGGRKMMPPHPHPHTASTSSSPPHPERPLPLPKQQQQQQQSHVVSLHPDPSSPSPWRQGGNGSGMAALSERRQGSAQSVDGDDGGSTTTSGSYTISPDELRLDGLLSPDVIV